MSKEDADRMTELAHMVQLPGSPLQYNCDFIVIARDRQSGSIGWVSTVSDVESTATVLATLQQILHGNKL